MTGRIGLRSIKTNCLKKNTTNLKKRLKCLIYSTKRPESIRIFLMMKYISFQSTVKNLSNEKKR